MVFYRDGYNWRRFWFLSHLLATVGTFSSAQNVRNIEVGFPAVWNGDQLTSVLLESKDIPKWLDGYLFSQLSASYGNPSEQFASRLVHMFDAVGAIGAFHFCDGEVRFSAKYIPTRAYKIWNFYQRNLTESKVAWNTYRSPYNITAAKKWDTIIGSSNDMLTVNPNTDIAKFGKKLIVSSMDPTADGCRINAGNLDRIREFHFKDSPKLIFANNPAMKIVSMPTHNQVDENGTIWSTAIVLDTSRQESLLVVFMITPNGLRRPVTTYNFGSYNVAACNDNGEYTGDMSVLAGYMQSIASTKNFLILPITSSYINPCSLQRKTPIDQVIGRNRGLDFATSVPLRFLVLDKRTKTWTTSKPFRANSAMFVTNQVNAFELDADRLVLDMMVYNDTDFYEKYLYVDYIVKRPIEAKARLVRFVLSLSIGSVQQTLLVPEKMIAAEFPIINEQLRGKAYRYAYLLLYPFAAGSAILKIDVDKPDGSDNVAFKADDNIALSQPSFVPRPGSADEDDGILLVRALNLDCRKGILYILDAKTMMKIGEAISSVVIPFGFSNRFYSSQQVGAPECSSGKSAEAIEDGDEQEANELQNLQEVPAETSTMTTAPPTDTTEEGTTSATEEGATSTNGEGESTGAGEASALARGSASTVANQNNSAQVVLHLPDDGPVDFSTLYPPDLVVQFPLGPANGSSSFIDPNNPFIPLRPLANQNATSSTIQVPGQQDPNNPFVTGALENAVKDQPIDTSDPFNPFRTNPMGVSVQASDPNNPFALVLGSSSVQMTTASPTPTVTTQSYQGLPGGQSKDSYNPFGSSGNLFEQPTPQSDINQQVEVANQGESNSRNRTFDPNNPYVGQLVSNSITSENNQQQTTTTKPTLVTRLDDTDRSNSNVLPRPSTITPSYSIPGNNGYGQGSMPQSRDQPGDNGGSDGTSPAAKPSPQIAIPYIYSYPDVSVVKTYPSKPLSSQPSKREDTEGNTNGQTFFCVWFGQLLKEAGLKTCDSKISY